MRKFKIFAFSDIHIDININGSYKYKNDECSFLEGFSKYLNHLNDIDLVICAGDISPKVEQIHEHLKFVSKSLDAQFYTYVPGNHDVWETENPVDDGISRIKYEEDIPEAVKGTDFQYLPDNPLIIDNKLAIIGNIGWYDYSLRNKRWDDYLKNERKTWYYAKTLDGSVWNDANFAEWGMHDLDIVKYCMDQLENDYKKIADVPNKIVVLHHIPFKEGVTFKNDITWDYYSAFMGASCFGKKLLDWDVNLGIYGHTHVPHSYKVNNCQLHCPTIGYEYEWGSNDLYDVFSERTKIIEFDLLI